MLFSFLYTFLYHPHTPLFLLATRLTFLKSLAKTSGHWSKKTKQNKTKKPISFVMGQDKTEALLKLQRYYVRLSPSFF